MNFRGLMVTENRAPVSRVAIESFKAQTDRNRSAIALICPPDQVCDYDFGQCAMDYSRFRKKGVPESLDAAARYIHKSEDFILSMWDDDDISHPKRIEQTKNAIELFDPGPCIVSYSKGWFVNARTLHGYLVEPNHLWGGTLAWNKKAFVLAGGIPDKFPGYDREFVKRARAKGALIALIRCSDNELPIALCHDKNSATHYFQRGEPMMGKLEAWLPENVFAAILDFQKFCIDRRIFPPWSD